MAIITTQRLVLDAPHPNDLQQLYDHVLSDADVMRMAFSGQTMSLEQSKVFFQANFDHDHSGKKLGILTERETGSFVGFAGLISCDVLQHPDYECGFVLRRAAWGRGYATEIGRAQVEYGLGELKLDRLLAQVAPQNEGSSAVLKKIGMEFHSSVENPERGERHIYIYIYISPTIFKANTSYREVCFPPTRSLAVAYLCRNSSHTYDKDTLQEMPRSSARDAGCREFYKLCDTGLMYCSVD